jgi:hypothetical protein
MNEEWIADTGPRRKGCSAQELLASLQQCVERLPNSRLVRNPVGNLAILENEEHVGYLDLTFGKVVLFEEENL